MTVDVQIRRLQPSVRDLLPAEPRLTPHPAALVPQRGAAQGPCPGLIVARLAASSLPGSPQHPTHLQTRG